MPNLVPIVEGAGEVSALPELLRRLLHDQERYDWKILTPKNARGIGGLTKQNGIERYIQFARKEPDCGGILVLIDGDAFYALSPGTRPQDNCSPALAKLLAQRVETLKPDTSVVVVVVRWEYESLFLASLETMAGKRIKGLPGLPDCIRFEGDVEEMRDPKRWIRDHFPPERTYSETRDQVAMTTMLDFDLLENRSRSFRRLKNALNQILSAHEQGECLVTPL